MNERTPRTAPEKVNAIIDVVIPQPFVRSEVFDVDDNLSINYTPQTIPGYSIPGAQAVSGLASYLYAFMTGAVFQELQIWSQNSCYKKWAVVRKDGADWLAIRDTCGIPGECGDYFKVRQNYFGAQGAQGRNDFGAVA